MKTIKFLSLCACALALFMYSCGKDKATTPTSGVQANTYDADTLAARAIIAANPSIATLAPTDAVCFRKEPRPAGTGPYRIVDVRLPNRGITVVPPEIGQLTALENIWLDSNAIASLPSQIGNCRALTFVNLSHNSLNTLPTEIATLTALTTLDLSHNSITALPAGFWSMTALTTVSLDYNSLASIDPLISNLVHLYMLDISHNQLADLPSSITGLSSMNSLVVDGNKLCATVTQPVADFISVFYGGTTWKATQTCQ
jgi:hypothetical protein